MLQSFYQGGTVALSLIHIALAISVTLHVLFTKRDVGASIGWIGLAWLSPILGSMLYLMFGINRVRRRAGQMRGTRPSRPSDARQLTAPGRHDYLAALERAGHRITLRPTENDNAVTLLHNGDEAYPQMIAAIDAARRSVGLSSYLFRADAIGLTFIDALDRARRRGVQVRVLIDGIGSGYFLAPAYWTMRKRGIEVVRFMHSPLPWRMPFINLRNHKKLLVVDGSVAFMGGLNIGDENLLLGKPPHPVRDVHFRLEGPIVTQLIEAFAEDWLFASGENLQGEDWISAVAGAGTAVARVVVSGPDQNDPSSFLVGPGDDHARNGGAGAGHGRNPVLALQIFAGRKQPVFRKRLDQTIDASKRLPKTGGLRPAKICRARTGFLPSPAPAPPLRAWSSQGPTRTSKRSSFWSSRRLPARDDRSIS